MYTDTVIPYEIISIKENTATVNEPELIKQGKNIHRMGSDYQQGDLLLKSGLKINSTIISTLASQGLAEVEVFKLPRVAIISTGNELIAPGTPIKDYQIRLSNSYALRSELKSFFPFSINRFHLIDDLSECNRKLTEIFNDHDILIISGGVSKGKFDFIPKALEDLKVEKHFHRISQRPGKPMWYGTKDEKQVFALPGNPMSGLVCMRRYVIPALQKRLGQENTRADHVKLDQNISLNGQLTQFKAARVINNNGYLSAKVIENNTSGDFFSLCHSNGIIEFEKGINDFNAGSVLAFYPWGK
ncbi:MAG: molybdopterin molybdotransferase [Thermoproteota archaeon]